MNFLFVIYSCKKNLTKANALYEKVNQKLRDCKCYILVANPQIKYDYQIIEDKYLVVKCGDDYENLCEKTLNLCKIIKYVLNAKYQNQVVGVFKCDDDIIPNITHLNQLIQFINSASVDDTIDYLGNIYTVTENYDSTGHYNKCSSPKYNIPKICYKCVYAAGPLYWLSMKSVCIIADTDIILNDYMYEDNMVGKILEENNIEATIYQTYSDDKGEHDSISIQNITTNHIKISP